MQNNTDTVEVLNTAEVARVNMHPFAEEHLTEVEGQVIEALRTWTRAQANPVLRRELFQWEELKFLCQLDSDEIEDYLEGKSPDRVKALTVVREAIRTFIDAPDR